MNKKEKSKGRGLQSNFILHDELDYTDIDDRELERFVTRLQSIVIQELTRKKDAEIFRYPNDTKLTSDEYIGNDSMNRNRRIQTTLSAKLFRIGNGYDLMSKLEDRITDYMLNHHVIPRRDDCASEILWISVNPAKGIIEDAAVMEVRPLTWR